jgi:hypothetical protein
LEDKGRELNKGGRRGTCTPSVGRIIRFSGGGICFRATPPVPRKEQIKREIKANLISLISHGKKWEKSRDTLKL